jgi:hypothetical protein
MATSESKRDLPRLIIPRSEAKQQVEGQISKLDHIFSIRPKNNQQCWLQQNEFVQWIVYTKELLRHMFDLDEIANEFAVSTVPKITSTMTVNDKTNTLLVAASQLRLILTSILQRLDIYHESIPDLQLDTRKNAIVILERLTNRFHLFAMQLTKRHGNREPFSVSDEYDLQDIFHGLLRFFFDDVRPEEWTPSHAAKSPRIDFLLKQQQIIIELKMTRPGLGASQIADQLIVDIERYKKHPDCFTIVCFVYDPSRLIENPIGLENDLSRHSDRVDVIVMVSPK